MDKPIELKPAAKVIKNSSPPVKEEEVMTEKTVEQTNLNVNIQPQSSSDMYPNFYGSHMGHTQGAHEVGCKACEFQRLQMQSMAAY